ncbi:MAG: hypothetical protein HZB53_19720 [Chloroflexi bacterium]|nr:hypothetical protein [Chloroflexota bacterium]
MSRLRLFLESRAAWRLLWPEGQQAATAAPLRAEVFGIERLEAHARAWAEQDRLLPARTRGQRLLKRLADNGRALQRARRLFSADASAGRTTTPATEWLLDNYYIVQQQLLEIERDLTRTYLQELPLAANAYGSEYPRVYGIALELIAHGDSRLDADSIVRFVSAYQTVAPLSIGELWAVAIMLRLGLIENLRRLAARSLDMRRSRADALSWAERILAARPSPAPALDAAFGPLAHTLASTEPAFGIHLLQALRDADPAHRPVIQWLEERLATSEQSVEAVVHAEHLRGAADQVSVGHVITSLRALAAIDWPTLIERMSLVDQILRDDPVGVYARMDFATRDTYRHAVERIGKRSRFDPARAANEQAVARYALALARRPADTERRRHIGYYLIGAGRSQVEEAAGYRPTLHEHITRLVLAHAALFYVGLIVLVTFGLILSILAYAAGATGVAPEPTLLVLAALMGLIPASAIAVSVVNQTISVEAETLPLPKLEFQDGLPPECRTMVVVPALLSQTADIQQLLDNQEIRYLANRDAHVHFAILGDFADAHESSSPEDSLLIEAARLGVQALNDRHRVTGQTGDRFYYFHRRRVWNSGEQVWMGWERKRGKLDEFNRLLRGATDTDYTVQEGDLSILPSVQFVITLDADTELPPNSARRLVGAMAHPLNCAVVDPASRRVLEGYGIIQPRTAITALSASATRFAQIFAGDSGLDPYATTSSDVYQDLFGAGSYVGKAIYDVDAVAVALHGRFPQNLLLSHDLLEGAYARAGLATDIQLLEDYPSGYDAYSQREHRWIRGDWQISDWLLPFVRDESGQRVPNPLPFDERLKILDNLRRSLVPASIVLLFVAGWLVLPGAPFVWTGLALVAIIIPQLLGMASQLGVHPPGETWLAYGRVLAGQAWVSFVRACLQTSFIVDEAVLTLDAIARVGVRRAITHRHLLQWNSAAVVERARARTLSLYCLRMWSSPLLAVLFALLVGWRSPPALLAAAPLLAAWFFAPVLAYVSSQPQPQRTAQLPTAARRPLRLIARKIWRFYETFAGAADHYLPPDNFQLAPVNVIAHRTSPTNVGFLLLADVAAYDLGHIGVQALVEHVEQTLATVQALELYHGHLYNWYDTQTLKALHPRFVSTVDSGNLAASLVVVKQTCLELMNAPVLSPVAWRGMQDISVALDEALTVFVGEQPVAAVRGRAMRAIAARLGSDLEPEPATLGAWLERLAAAAADGRKLSGNLRVLAEKLGSPPGDAHADVIYWCTELEQWLSVQRATLTRFVPEAGMANVTSALLASMPTLADLATAPAPSAVLTSGDRMAPPMLADVGAGRIEAARLRARLLAVSRQADALLAAMDFRFLFDPQRELFSIGFHGDTHRLDGGFYDLLASEARLTSFMSIAQGQAPMRHWFKLDRTLTHTTGSTALLSWGGTMFEYLMPVLWTNSYERTLLHQTCRVAVRSQIAYGDAHGVPWGVSESGYAAVDYQQNYQYHMFGVPDLSLRREPDSSLVIAPYATFLALPFEPQAAWRNLQRLAREGAVGTFGYYEAVDYTSSRRPKGQRFSLVRSYMAHHQGMSLCALDNLLNDGILQRRFHREPMVAASEVLLQEKLPRHVPIISPHPAGVPSAQAAPPIANQRYTTPHTWTPRAYLLSNGTYTVMVTNTGAGYSACNKMDVTRWRADPTCDPWGTIIYVADQASHARWSATYLPAIREPERYEAVYALGRVSFKRTDAGIATLTEIAVSPEHNVEVRRVTLTNETGRARDLQLTSYAEVALAAHGADLAHPAFGKLFIESEFLPERAALLFKRRARDAGQSPAWAIHLVALDGAAPGGLQCETDRARFVGRGRSARGAAAQSKALSNTVGAVLDPIMSLRGVVHLSAGAQATMVFVTGVAESRDDALRLIDTYRDQRAIERIFDLSEANTQVQLRHLDIGSGEAQLYQRLASRVLYPDQALLSAPAVRERNRQGQTDLYAYGISGDHPIVLVKVAELADISLVRQALLAHEYWRMHNFTVDLVILNGHGATYGDPLHDAIQSMIDTSLSHPWVDKAGGVFLRRADYIPEDGKVLLETVARVVIDAQLGSLAEHLERSVPIHAAVNGAEVSLRARAKSPLPKLWNLFKPERRTALINRRKTESDIQRTGERRHVADRRRTLEPAASPDAALHKPALLFGNGLGGFDGDRREYVIVLNKGRTTPLPWSNVLSNEHFGSVVTESGLGFTWAGNSQLNRLSPWSNDPVCDPPGEVIYIRDDDTGDLSSPTPLPIRDEGPYVIQHGAGYTRYTHRSHRIVQELLVFVPVDDPVKVLRLKLRNEGPRPCALSVTSYIEWVLGVTREQSRHFVVSALADGLNALIARNTYNSEFRERVAFSAVAFEAGAGQIDYTGFTTDRTEFIGRNGSLQNPAGLSHTKLPGETGTVLDPCAALQVQIRLRPHEGAEVVFLIGEGQNAAEARALITKYSVSGQAQKAFNAVNAQWDTLLGAVQVRTPDAAMDLLLNQWLVYQTLACRVWGRSAFYQSAGAFGYRDQLQDVMALVHAAPQVARAHILRAAAQQFSEGDAMHWWHPPGGAGVRTGCSDDYLWLPYVAEHYVVTTGDESILEEAAPFLEAPILRPDQAETYLQPLSGIAAGTLYAHCTRALDRALSLTGVHGLPLMGTGDWNDGMNEVGRSGSGESVWLGWFLYANLIAFGSLAKRRADPLSSERYLARAAQLQQALAQYAWDGEWYRRAYFDDGTPLGSVQNAECRIDSLAQSWATISGAAPAARAAQALQSADRQLVDEPNALIRLLAPPFEHGTPNPGYIQGYVPGIRENGGQYTHAALWMVLAHAMQGHRDRAAKLFALLNPINHALTLEMVARYQVEPYVVAADVYAHPQHSGRGGWTWYTGAAGWMYRIGLESILGLKRRGATITIEPCVPADWKSYQITYRHGAATYVFDIQNPAEGQGRVARVTLDDVDQPSASVTLVDDGQTHRVSVLLAGS